MSRNFDHISPFLTRELDLAWPSWKSEVPEDKVEGLDEESLIQLLKNQNRASFYRFVSDKNKQFFTDLFTNQDKSFWELTQELNDAGYERMQKGWEMEEKLNSIILQFRAKGKIDKVEILRPSLNALQTEFGKAIDVEKQTYDSQIDAAKNNSINEISRGDEEITQKLNNLFNTQIGKLKKENEEMFEDIKRFVYEEKIGLLGKKVDKMESGELSIDALKRSDLFTDEEITNLRKKQEQLLENIFDRKKRVNLETFSDVVKRGGFSSNDDFVQKMNAISDDVISVEAKKAIQDLIKDGFLIEQEETKEGSRRKRSSPTRSVISILLGSTASYLQETAKAQKYLPQGPRPSDHPIYQWCNGNLGWLKHIATIGFCSGYTATIMIGEAAMGYPVDLNGLANVLSFVSFLVALPLGGWPVLIKGAVLSIVSGIFMDKVCESVIGVSPDDYKPTTAFFCTFILSTALSFA